MIVEITEQKWQATREYLKERGDRFAELVASADQQPDRATKDWSVSETAAHVRTLAWVCASLVDPREHTGDPEGDASPFDDLSGLVENTIIDTVADFNTTLLGEFTERDPRKLAEQVRSDVDRILRATEGADPARAVAWAGGSKLPLAGLLAHLLNEMQIHGRDIARATGSRWHVPSAEAAMFIDLFLIGVTHYGYGRLLDGHGPWPKRRLAVEFTSKYTTPRTMVLDDNVVTVEEPGGQTDVRVSFDPTVLNLMLFNRISKVRAALTGKVVVKGRRPWRMSEFERVMHLP